MCKMNSNKKTNMSASGAASTMGGDLTPPPNLRMDSFFSGSDGSESDDSGSANGGQNEAPQTHRGGRNNDDVNTTPGMGSKSSHAMVMSTTSTSNSTTSVASLSMTIMSGGFQAFAWVAFSLYFPFLLAPHAAKATYHPASYHYDPTKSHFDNTAWTYGTDYALAVIMAVLGGSILSLQTTTTTTTTTGEETSTNTNRLCRRAASLLLLYGVSVTAGGLAHQHFTTLEMRNTPMFRLLWSVCVGTVCAASCSMGMSGSEMLARYKAKVLVEGRSTGHRHSNYTTQLLLRMPIFSDAFWLAFGLTVTAICVWGGMSFQRPACDIFIAGITQSLSTFYCMIFFFLVDNEKEEDADATVAHDRKANNKVQHWAKVVGLVGFILNAPLLPMYPLLVQYTDWSLASVNTLLHSWLCVAWCMQGLSMRHVIQVILATTSAADKTKRA